MKKLFSLILVLCLLCSATTVLCETPTQEIKVGKVTFQIPAGLSGGMYASMDVMEAHDYYDYNAGYGITMATFELSFFETDQSLAQAISTKRIGDDNSCALYWALQLYGGWDASRANDIVKNAAKLSGMPDGGKLLLNAKTKGFAATAHAYRGIGFSIFPYALEGSSISQSQLETIAQNIAMTFRLEGVTEEEMAADAAAAAAQKYIVITNGSANIRAKADSKSDRITTAYQGDTFPLLGEEGTWYMIEVNGQTAYVSQGLCKIKE